MSNTPIPQQPEYLKNLVEQNPFNEKYIKAEARRALKALKLRLKKDMKFEQIMGEMRAKKNELKQEIALNVGAIVDLKKNGLDRILEVTVEKVFEQVASQEVLDKDLLESELYADFDFHIDFELVELFKKVRSNRESKHLEYTTVPPSVSTRDLTSALTYGNIHTFVVTQDGGKFSKVIGVVSRDVLSSDDTTPIGDSPKMVSITEPLPVEEVHALMFQNKLAHYPLLDLENKLVDIVSFQEMELIIKKRTKQSIQTFDTSRQLHDVLPENRPLRTPKIAQSSEIQDSK